MIKLNLQYGLVAVAAMGLSANVSATDLTCDDITFTPDAFASYEFIDQACLAVVDRDGAPYAKFTATKVAGRSDATYIRFQNPDGTEGPRHKSNMPPSYVIMLSDMPVTLANVEAGQKFNIYVGSEYWVSNAAVEEAAEEVVDAAIDVAVAEEVAEDLAVDEAEDAVVEEEVIEVLPTTAGPLPWLALFGSLFLLIGGALRFSRKP